MAATGVNLFGPARLLQVARSIRAHDELSLASFETDVRSIDADSGEHDLNAIFGPCLACDELVGALADAIEPTSFGVSVLRVIRECVALCSVQQ